MRNKNRVNKHILYLVLLIIGSLLISIGYATVNSISLNIVGTAELAENGIAKIISIITVDSLNVTEVQEAGVDNPKISDDGQGVSFKVSMSATNSDLQNNKQYYIKYKITIENDSLFDYSVQATNFTPTITGNGTTPNVSYDITDLNGNSALGDIIPAKTTKEYYVTINFYPSSQGSWTATGETEIGTGISDEGIILGSIPANTTCDLSGNNTRCLITATVINTYQNSKTFNFNINNSNFILVDANDNPLSNMTIAAESTNTYNFYIKTATGARFPSNTQRLNINLTSTDDHSSMGIVDITVDPDPTLFDDEAPIVSNVTAQIKPDTSGNYTNYQLYVSWNGYDNVGVDHYVVETYRSTTLNGTYTKISTDNTVADETYINITVPNDAYYYFKVYGVDLATPANTATASEISSCPSVSNTTEHCMSSTKEQFKWNFTVRITLSNAQIVGQTATNNVVTYNVMYNDSISAQINGSGNNYNSPSNMTNPRITYADGTTETLGNNINQAGYSYTDNGALNIWKINGDITMTANGRYSCLAKGTKILLANGKTKNIEDITYTDLLAVWNYDTGSITYEYPLWIEKEHIADKYTRVTFSDGSYIDVVGEHSFYNTDINLFVNIIDKDNFHVGTHVGKVNDDGIFEEVTVTSIKEINKEVEYYFVGSTTYFNIIANNLLTTDREVAISNLYGFDNNATWPKEKQDIVNNKDNIIPYEAFKDALPYYLYDGFRAGEVGYLINNNILTLDEFKYWIITYVMAKDIFVPPIQINNSNYWMVTTSIDEVNDDNKYSYLKEEGSKYILPTNDDENFKGWLNTSNNKIYYPNDEIEVYHGLHFIAIYK